MVELGGEPRQPPRRALQIFLDQSAGGLAGAEQRPRLMGSDQAREVALQAVLECEQRVRPGLLRVEPAVGERALDLALGVRRSERGAQAAGELRDARHLRILAQQGCMQANRLIGQPLSGPRPGGERHHHQQADIDRERPECQRRPVGRGRMRRRPELYAEQRQHQPHEPHRHAAARAGEEPGARGARPTQQRNDPRQELRHRQKRDHAHLHQSLVLAHHDVGKVANADHRGQQQPSPAAQLPIQVPAAAPRQPQRQREVVQAHAAERQGLHDEHGARRRDTPDVRQQRQRVTAVAPGKGQHEIIRRRRARCLDARPQDERNRQIEQRQVKRVQPRGAPQPLARAVLDEQHVKAARQQEGRRRGKQQKRHPAVAADRCIHPREQLWVPREPATDTRPAAEHHHHHEHAGGEQRHELDARLERDRHHQAFMAGARAQVAGPERYGEQCDERAERGRQEWGVGGVPPGQHLHRAGHGADLQRHVRQQPEQHEHRDQRSGESVGIAERQQIGQRLQLAVAHHPQDR